MRIIAVDPGYERMGVAVIEKIGGKEKLLYSTCVRTSPELEFSDRLFALGEEFWLLLRQWKPKIFAVEKLYFETNQKTAMSVCEVKGALSYLAKLEKLEVREFTPLEVKVAITGYGKASKQDVRKMLDKLINIEKEKDFDDEYDAIAIALTCFATQITS